MSEWAYRECEKCGKRIHINNTCKRWGNSEDDCDGDPWGVKTDIIEEINSIDEDIKSHEKLIEELKKYKSDLTEKLSKL